MALKKQSLLAKKPGIGIEPSKPVKMTNEQLQGHEQQQQVQIMRQQDEQMESVLDTVKRMF